LGEFSKTLKSIVSELCNSVDEISQIIQIAKQEAEERQRQWDIQREKDRREAEEKRQAKNLKDSRDELFSIIETWAEAKRIDEFFKDAQLRANDLSDEDRQSIEVRLIEARKLLGTIDALEHFKQWKSPLERD
jgi:DNA phosphorothioation-dependent restriction protein DptG